MLALVCKPSEGNEVPLDAATPWADQTLVYQQHFKSEARAQRASIHVALRCCGTSDRVADTARQAALDSVMIFAELDSPPALYTLALHYADSLMLVLPYMSRAAELGLPTAIEGLKHFEEFISSDGQ